MRNNYYNNYKLNWVLTTSKNSYHMNNNKYNNYKLNQVLTTSGNNYF